MLVFFASCEWIFFTKCVKYPLLRQCSESISVDDLEAGSYLVGGSMEMGPQPAATDAVAQYANDVVAAMNARPGQRNLVRDAGHRIVSLERCESDRIHGHQVRLQPQKSDHHSSRTGPTTLGRSNSLIGFCPSKSQGPYLELLSDDGYEKPRTFTGSPAPHPFQPIEQPQQRPLNSNSSNSQIDVNDECLSDVTDESCVPHSPTPLCTEHQVFRISSCSDVNSVSVPIDCWSTI